MSPTVTAPVNNKRQPKNAPASAGGQYTERQRNDFAGSLTGDRTKFSGYDLRKHRALGHGSSAPSWTATVFRDNTAAIVITDSGNGEGPQFIALGDGMDRAAKEMVAFRFLATELFGKDKDAAEKFGAVLKLSAEIDRHAKENDISRPEAVYDYVQSEEIEADDAKLYIHGYVD